MNIPGRCIQQNGAVTLVTTLILITVSTMIIIFAAKYGVMQQKSNANQIRANQAFEAAEAGLEFGIMYLQTNSSAILATASGGFLQPYTNSSVTNVALGNGSHFTVVYTNPVANDYARIRVSATGTSDDAAATKTVSQEVQYGSVLMYPPIVPLIARDDVHLSANAIIRNLYSATTVNAGDDVDLDGGSQTILSSGQSSNSSIINSDIDDDISSLKSLSSNDLFATYFGSNKNTIKNIADFYYSNSISTNYSSILDGKAGSIIWIDQTGGAAQIRGNTTIGTDAAPVLLIVNGNMDLFGNVIITGFVFVSGTTSTDFFSNVIINGGLVSGGDFSMSGSAALNYEPGIISVLRQSPSLMYYAKIPGSWKDF